MSFISAMNGVIKIPDTRFEQTFRRAIDREVAKQNALSGKSTDDKKSGPSAYVICKVVVRDVLLMPFIQSVLWTGFLLGLKPWLRMVVGFGRRTGEYLNRALYGGRLPGGKTATI